MAATWNTSNLGPDNTGSKSADSIPLAPLVLSAGCYIRLDRGTLGCFLASLDRARHFLDASAYRIFVQMKHGNMVETGAFDACAASSRK